MDVVHVREILDLQPVTPLPRVAADVNGAFDVRGTAVPVVDLSWKLGIMAAKESEDTRFLVFEFSSEAGPTKTLAVRADKVLEVSQISSSEIEEPPSESPEWSHDIVLGVARSSGRLTMLINLEPVSASEK